MGRSRNLKHSHRESSRIRGGLVGSFTMIADRRLVIQAAAQAQRAADFILSRLTQSRKRRGAHASRGRVVQFISESK